DDLRCVGEGKDRIPATEGARQLGDLLAHGSPVCSAQQRRSTSESALSPETLGARLRIVSVWRNRAARGPAPGGRVIGAAGPLSRDNRNGLPWRKISPRPW